MNTILGGVMTAMVTAPLCFFLYELYTIADSVAIKTSPVMKGNDDSSMAEHQSIVWRHWFESGESFSFLYKNRRIKL